MWPERCFQFYGGFSPKSPPHPQEYKHKKRIHIRSKSINPNLNKQNPHISHGFVRTALFITLIIRSALSPMASCFNLCNADRFYCQFGESADIRFGHKHKYLKQCIFRYRILVHVSGTNETTLPVSVWPPKALLGLEALT